MPRRLQFFNPDPEIPDSDLLGFGDLMYDDGSTEYLSDDPELAASLPRPEPMGPPQAFGPPEAPQMEPISYVDEDTGQQVQIDPTGNISLDPMGMPTGDPADQNPAGAYDLGDMVRGVGDALEIDPLSQFGQQQPDEMAAPPPPIQPATFVAQEDGQTYQVDPTGNITPAAPEAPGMVPMQREGALPPELAARQQAEMGAMQQQGLAATEQARGDEARIYNELVLKQMAQNEAQRLKAEEDVAEQQAKVERFQREQQDLAEQDVATDLISARGPIGAAFGVLGAALFGAIGSDAGLRQIDKAIDQNVRLQVQQKGTKLALLAEKIGSAQVAIKLGKAAIYDAAIRHGELLMQKTKGDVFEAQTPEILQKMREKGLAEMQEAERISLGRTIEKAPLPPKPPSPEALQKYGELRREREGNDSITQRMDQTLGLVWSPGQNGQPGRYVNKDEVLKNGIQGTGNLEQLLPDILYATGGGVTAEGRQVRGAAEAMAFAQLRAVQPTGPISNSDIERAVKMGALDTEEGLLLGLERMHTAAEEQITHDAAQFGPDVVGEYERRRQQSGGQGAPAQPAASRPATVEEKRGAAAALRQQKAGPDPQAAARTVPAEPAERMAQVREDLQALAPELPPGGLAILVAQAAHESGEGDSEGAAHGNMFGHKRTGNRQGFNAATTEGEGKNARRTRADFAAYPTITDGVADHLSLLKRKYPRAWEALEVEDPDGFVAALKDGGYFTANEDRYRSAILRRL